MGARRKVGELQLQDVQGSLQQQTGTERVSKPKKKERERVGEETSENLKLSQGALRKLGLLCGVLISPDPQRGAGPRWDSGKYEQG